MLGHVIHLWFTVLIKLNHSPSVSYVVWTDSYQNTRFHAVIWQSVTGKYIKPAIVCKNWPVCLYARKGKLIVLQLNRLATHVEFDVAYLCSIVGLLFKSFFSPAGFTVSRGFYRVPRVLIADARSSHVSKWKKSITPSTSTTNVVCGLSFSRSQPDFEGFLRALRFPPSSKIDS